MAFDPRTNRKTYLKLKDAIYILDKGCCHICGKRISYQIKGQGNYG